jgi:hypothetical protein
MGNTTIGAITLHNGTNATITENSCSKDATLTVLPLYLSDSDETDVFDFGGVTKTINLSGTYYSSSTAALKSWIDSIEALVQGHQDTDAGYPLTFTDDMRGTIKVKIFSFSSTWTEGDPSKITWSMKIVEASENA